MNNFKSIKVLWELRQITYLKIKLKLIYSLKTQI
jgi:hypothetical protein